MRTDPEKGTSDRPGLADRSPILRWLLGRKKPASASAPLPDALAAGLAPVLPKSLANLLERHPHWAGPRYLRGSAWCRDLLDVTSSAAAIARANRPLSSGLNAVLNEVLNSPDRSGPGTFLWAGLVSIPTAVALLVWWSVTYERVTLISAVPLAAVLILPVFLHLTLARYFAGGSAKKRLLAALAQRLSRGEALSEAMYGLHRFFPAHYADLAAAGERTGAFAACLTQLEGESSRRVLLGQRSRLPYRYLLFVVGISIVVGSFVLLKVFPVLIEILNDFGVPGRSEFFLLRLIETIENTAAWTPSLVLQALSVKSAFVLIPLLVLIGVLFFPGSERRSKFWLRLPFFGHTAVLRSLHHASLLLCHELDAGIPMTACLEHVIQSDLQPAHRRIFERLNQRVEQGESLTGALRECGSHLLPRSFRHFVELGEASGQLPKALNQVAELYWPILVARQRILRTCLLCAAVIAVSGVVFLVVETTFAVNVAVVDAAFYEL